jgi:endoglucanase
VKIFLSSVIILLLVSSLAWHIFHEQLGVLPSLASSSRHLSLSIDETAAPTPYPSPTMEVNNLPQHLPSITPLPAPSPTTTPIPLTESTPTPTPRPIIRAIQASSVTTAKVTTPVHHGLLYAEDNLDITHHIYRSKNTDEIRLFTLLNAQPQAKWFGNWNSTIALDVDNYVTAATRTGTIPVLVTYNIPYRDCGGYSAGGADTEKAYLTWIRRVAEGIRNRTAWVILEPDSLALLDCLPADQQNSRISLLQQASSILVASGAQVYLDAGHPNWIPADQIAKRLVQAGINKTQGFTLNISNFATTENSIAYGQAVSTLVSGKHFLIDTSRNGNGPTPDFQWCNPIGRAVGNKPTTQTGNPLVDAYVWVKHPGESDGTCNGGPDAGKWWPEYALGLLKNAGW